MSEKPPRRRSDAPKRAKSYVGIECFGSKGAIVPGDSAFVLRMKEFMEKGVCGGCEGGGEVIATDQSKDSNKFIGSDVPKIVRICEACNGTGKYRSKKKAL